MRRKLLLMTVIVAAALAACACSDGEEKQRTTYNITAELSADNLLTASAEIDYVNNTDVPLDEVWFHLYPNAYREGAKFCPIAKDRLADAFPDGRSYSKLDIERVTAAGRETEIAITGEDENILAVPLSSVIDPGERVKITVDYKLKLPKVRHRLGYTDKTVNLANFYPIACVYEGGAFAAYPYYSTGDPFYSECSDYCVTLTAPAKFKAGGTGRAEKVKSDDATSTYRFTCQNVRDFAAVLGEYTLMSGTSGTTVVNYYYYNDADPEGALAAAIDSLGIFGEMFGTYPYPEYTVCQTGFLQGGMEYPCLSMLSDAYKADAKRDIIVHETAHQWWYGLVGNDEVKYAWLDEGLAEYCTMLFYERAEGYNYTFNGKRADALSAYMLYCETYKNGGLGDTTMTRAVNEYSGETEYSYMTYVKGALMLDDIKNTVGTSAFISGLRNYASDRRYGIAKPEHLIAAIQASSGKRLDVLFESWLSGNVKLFGD